MLLYVRFAELPIDYEPRIYYGLEGGAGESKKEQHATPGTVDKMLPSLVLSLKSECHVGKLHNDEITILKSNLCCLR